MLLIVAILTIGGLVGAAVITASVPAVLALMAYDTWTSRRRGPTVEPDVERRISLERGFARSFVIFGGLFWAVATFAGYYSFRQTGMSFALMAAFIPLVATIATLIVGWYFERATAALLVLASFAVVVYGVVLSFELGVWTIVTLALIGPMMTAAILFWLARNDQEAFELDLALQSRPELVPVTPMTGPQF
jgi:hypothetical protein